MNAIVRLALARPYTFVVMAILIVIAGTLSAIRTPKDIFPTISIPVVAVAWTYTNLSPQDMSGRIQLPFQRALTTTVNDIEHIEGQALTGIGITKVFFQPGADIRLANAQVTAIAQTLLRQLPLGTTPPLILNYNASTVPILQLGLSGTGLTEQQLYDFGFNFIRTRLVMVPGAAIPFPTGGRVRQIQMDLNPSQLQARGVSGLDVANTLSIQTQITPAGFVKIGEYQYNLRLNNAPLSVEQLNTLPIRTVNGAVVRIRDVAHVRDGSLPQQNIVHVDGQRSALLTVLKSGETSTIAIVQGIRDTIPDARRGLPAQLQITPVNDQSLFVRAAVSGVLREGAIAAGLTSLMILLFLGSWRSTLIVATSIPLSILGAVALLSVLGQTLNVMTLGGLALAVGILVDEATVTIENIERHLEMGKDVHAAIIDGSGEIIVPAFLSLLCICIVFVPMFYLPGVSGFLFVPMALSVMFAMTMSFILSRTLVPTMAMFLLRAHRHESKPAGGLFTRFQQGFERRFAAFRERYGTVLEAVLAHRGRFVGLFLGFAVLSLVFLPFLGRNFFPQVDAGAMTLHVRGPVGMRIEETAALFLDIEKAVRARIPADEVLSIADMIGLPNSAINVSYSASGTIGPEDGDILIALKENHHATQRYIRRLRAELPRLFPQASFAFLPSDITSQILNFGAPAPIDVQVSGPHPDETRQFAELVLREIRHIDGLVDARIQQPANYPELRFEVDRTRINQLGLTEGDVTSSIATSIAGTSQTAPLYWLNPQNNVTYPIAVQMPEYRIGALSDVIGLPVTGTGAQATRPQVLGALGTITRGTTSPVEGQYNIRPLIDVFAGNDGRDLGAVASDVQSVLVRLEHQRPATVTVTLRGQYQSMNTAFTGLGAGLLGAVVLIYLLIVVNFQSWTDPCIIILALPAALAGICWMLFATGTPLSVPALTGAIMCMGVATANSILVIAFCREQLDEHGDALRAALTAGKTRLRPVLMTALAMVIGMLPMAMGFGEGGEQNAPLGRAVVGGLVFATCASLFFVPTLFAIIYERRARPATRGASAHA
ncbi:RND transporter [Gluconacetobacter liquefaciens]|uniref:Efflux RND transporter permease subunit n=1 Tax=Gluconacetobacter liquefaciens TaxID=89584 RepID=A0A370G4Y3_GLULI|nr:efflux RND transporter permease subunit [Gluconacetobacter liquefaciens]MBB2187135.1 efflux RND transporter permease subunit [Gluconacetobacter liquefaciens]RDI37113.1 multidrug efflux pump subunit AcrB [Gluconacetobacter liquefaciens]GBQ94023.1 cation/multidrug efflux pump [Gluconacetobacter liquefaciens NRIC 0522]GEB37860.1 RND transporter [Gluconacetobacter liquefaciens]